MTSSIIDLDFLKTGSVVAGMYKRSMLTELTVVDVATFIFYLFLKFTLKASCIN